MFTESLDDILSKKEELHEDLKPCLSKNPFPMLRHPLMYHMMYTEQMNALINKQYEYKKQALLKYKEQKDWAGCVFVYERPYRLSAFLEVERNLSDKDYWEILSSIWIDSENIWQNKETWKNLIKSDRAEKQFFMIEEEQEYLANLADVVTVYRGCIKNKNKTGLSYTLNKSKAEWFAKRFGKDGVVIEREVKKSKIFAYLNGRNEDEVIVL
jgi:hypothetical protein